MTDICNAFPGYEYQNGHNFYRGEDVGRGGYAWSRPGIWSHLALLDIASMHPHSAISMNCFGDYTKNFEELVEARICIKHGDYEAAGKLLGGKLKPFLKDKAMAKALSQALKIAINSVYGLTSASFENPFKDIRNVNNIVALKGALFMVTLRDEVIARGYNPVHIKTDSIKIADADQSIIDFCMDFATEYGYTFEHEATYDRMCIVDKAQYIALYSNDEVNGDHKGTWTATGTLFQVPYIFKSLFSNEPIEFRDLCETKEVQTVMYLDMNEALPQLSLEEVRELDILREAIGSDDSKMEKAIRRYNYDADSIPHRYNELLERDKASHDYIHVGKVGLFCPMKPGTGGGYLYREGEGGKMDAVANTKGTRWMEAELVKTLGKEADIDISYWENMKHDAYNHLAVYDDPERFIHSPIGDFEALPF